MKWIASVLIAVVGIPAIGAQTVHRATTGGTVAAVAPAPIAPPVAGERVRRWRESERMIRGCGGAYSSVVNEPATVAQPSVVQPSVRQPQIGVSQPLPYTPPVPAQVTASQAMVREGQVGATTASSCWTTDGRGHHVVARP
ncbi:MAG: hypothetical protein ABI205_05720 [Gemmatimonadaceae bacterium]